MTLFIRDQNKLDSIEDAIREAQRFIKKALVAKDALAGGKESFYHSKSYAAAKRASLDLTRSLSAMRQRRDYDLP